MKSSYLWFIVGLFMAAVLVVTAADHSTGDTPKSLDFDKPRAADFSSGAPAHVASIRVLSWNIDRGTELNTLSTELAANPADLCLFQEVDWNDVRSHEQDIGAELAKRLHLIMAYAIEFEELSQERGQPAYIGQATLTRFPIRRSRVLRFKRQSGFWKPHSWLPSNVALLQRRLGSRVALVTDLEVNGKLLVVYNAHLESRSMGKIQLAQLDEILADLKTYPAGTPAMIGGDLNSKYFPGIFLRKLEKEGFKSALGDKVERTHTIVMALDWLFVRGPFTWTDGTVRHDLKGSDHYPIYAKLNAAS